MKEIRQRKAVLLIGAALEEMTQLTVNAAPWQARAAASKVSTTQLNYKGPNPIKKDSNYLNSWNKFQSKSIKRSWSWKNITKLSGLKQTQSEGNRPILIFLGRLLIVRRTLIASIWQLLKRDWNFLEISGEIPQRALPPEYQVLTLATELPPREDIRLQAQKPTTAHSTWSACSWKMLSNWSNESANTYEFEGCDTFSKMTSLCARATTIRFGSSRFQAWPNWTL